MFQFVSTVALPASLNLLIIIVMAIITNATDATAMIIFSTIYEPFLFVDNFFKTLIILFYNPFLNLLF